jgi:ABC-type branched-subunit amino acid transport system substrate-binding protein
MGNMNLNKHLILVILLIGGLLVVIPGKSDPKLNQIITVKVGLLTPQNGSLSHYSQGFEQAAQFAIDDLNNDLTINSSYLFELSIYDTQDNATHAAVAMQSAVDDGMHYVVGPARSSNTLAAAPIAVANQIPIIGYSSTSPEISTYNDHANPLDHGYLWRTVGSDANHGHGMASLAFDGNFKKMAILTVDDIWGLAQADIIETDFEKLGGDIVYSESFPRNTSDFTLYIDNLLNTMPDIITVPAFANDIAYVHLELASRNSTIPIISPSYDPNVNIFDIAEGVQEAMQGTITIVISVRDTDVGQFFREAYEAKYSIGQNDIFLEHTYDAVFTGALAITTIGSIEGADIISALSNIKFEGASGPIEFDENGDSLSALYKFSEIRSTAIEPVAQWGTIEGLVYTDPDFMERWRSLAKDTVTVESTIENTIETTIENTVETTVTELSATIPVSSAAIFFGIFVPSLIIMRRKQV